MVAVLLLCGVGDAEKYVSADVAARKPFCKNTPLLMVSASDLVKIRRGMPCSGAKTLLRQLCSFAREPYT
ncbi:hypothetical protein [Prosthecochloris sp. ZM_2]|uniref:hypothetical protein n=1 Tax=Prosthecochloris sp. ZM_2 TaxID=2045206 RepID=UPI0011CE1C7E|nr:hypothetical protein [Prosthecochloris sp. ZM_2]